MTLSDAERERYPDQLALGGWDERAQEGVRESSAIVVGAGGLGAPACAYLAAAGVGRIGIVDDAVVEVPSLTQQALHFAPEVGTSKAESAAHKVGLLNPEVRGEPYPVRLEPANAVAIVTGADVALDCSDSGETRSLVNEACCSERVPLVVAGSLGLTGFLMSIRPGASACHACVFGEGPPETGGSPGDPRAGGSLGAMAGALGALQALEALKLLTGLGTPLLDRVMRLDGRDMAATVESVERRADCPACADVGAAPQSV